MAVLAHPDDESLGFGGTLARYAPEGIETFVVTATRGEGGRYRGHARERRVAPRPGEARRDSRGGIARRRVGARRPRSVAARLSRSGARSRGSAGGDRPDRRAPATRASGRRGDVRTRRRVRPSRSHRDLAVHHRRAGRRRRSIVRRSRIARRRIAAARREEAVLPGVAGRDLGRLPGSVQEARLHGRRRRTAGGAVARLGDHDDRSIRGPSGRLCGTRCPVTSRR